MLYNIRRYPAVSLPILPIYFTYSLVRLYAKKTANIQHPETVSKRPENNIMVYYFLIWLKSCYTGIFRILFSPDLVMTSPRFCNGARFCFWGDVDGLCFCSSCFSRSVSRLFIFFNLSVYEPLFKIGFVSWVADSLIIFWNYSITE